MDPEAGGCDEAGRGRLVLFVGVGVGFGFGVAVAFGVGVGVGLGAAVEVALGVAGAAVLLSETVDASPAGPIQVTAFSVLPGARFTIQSTETWSAGLTRALVTAPAAGSGR